MGIPSQNEMLNIIVARDYYNNPPEPEPEPEPVKENESVIANFLCFLVFCICEYVEIWLILFMIYFFRIEILEYIGLF